MLVLPTPASPSRCNLHTFQTCKDLYHYVYDQLVPIYPIPGERRSVVLRLLEHYFECDNLSIHLAKPLQPNIISTDTVTKLLQRLYAHEPIQYITQVAPFLGRNFMVTPAVLIPRPETEEWVAALVKKHAHQPNLSILDIGTGSGCIAITLAKDLDRAVVTGLDVSEDALAVAQHNATRHQAAVDWLVKDILQDTLPDKKWHLFVSNPPYVPQSEQAQMHQRVWAYEPKQAIFVPDESPLLLYKPVVKWAWQHLYAGGYIYLETHEKYAPDVAQILTNHYFSNITIQKDMQGKNRLVTAIRP